MLGIRLPGIALRADIALRAPETAWQAYGKVQLWATYDAIPLRDFSGNWSSHYTPRDGSNAFYIKEAAKRRGISEAEIIRQGIHLAAMANRVWDEPLFSRTFEGPGRTLSRPEVRDTVTEAVRRETGPGSGSAA